MQFKNILKSAHRLRKIKLMTVVSDSRKRKLKNSSSDENMVKQARIDFLSVNSKKKRKIAI